MQEQLQQQKVMDASEPGEIRMKLWETGWQQQRLYTGDYWFFTHDYKKVGVERKAMSDLLSSIGDRLSRQLENLLEHYDIKILLIEGSWKTVYEKGNFITNRGIEYHTRTMVWNYLRRFQDKGLTLELTTNEGNTIQRLNELYALYQKPYSLSSISREFTDDRILALPSGSRGKTGMNVLEGKSLREVGLMGVIELEQVEGIGKKKAQSIYGHFNRRNSNESNPNRRRD